MLEGFYPCYHEDNDVREDRGEQRVVVVASPAGTQVGEPGQKTRLPSDVVQKLGDPDGPELQRTMKLYNLNEPQTKAILNALKTEGFSLIQGYGLSC